MTKWELVMITSGRGGPLLYPAGKIDLNLIPQKHPKTKIRFVKEFDADQLDVGSDAAEATRAYHSLLEWPCSEGWEPFAVSGGMVYLKRQI